jgi:hypothetical protein
MTRCSTRAPKLKEVEVGEGSLFEIYIQFDFSTKVEPFVRMNTKKEFSQPPAFGDTEASTRSKVVLPQWGDLFNSIIREYYPDFIPHSDPDVTMLDD